MAFIQLKNVINRLAIPYQILRKVGNVETDENGIPVYTDNTFSVNMLCTRIKKSDMEWDESTTVGNQSNVYLNVRVNKNQTKLLENDYFTFGNETFRIMKEKPYQDNTLDFYTYVALRDKDGA